MLPKGNRLRKKKDFERVFQKGKGLKEDLLVFKKIKNNLNRVRIGFVVSQKISKKATLRNKVKRRLREIIKEKIKKIKTGVDILIIAIPGIEKKDFWENEETINKLLKKAKLIK